MYYSFFFNLGWVSLLEFAIATVTKKLHRCTGYRKLAFFSTALVYLFSSSSTSNIRPQLRQIKWPCCPWAASYLVDPLGTEIGLSIFSSVNSSKVLYTVASPML